jgi:hypothetical protein
VFRPTTGIALMGLVVVGLIIGDFLTHPSGTTAAGNAAVAIVKPTETALLGVVPS